MRYQIPTRFLLAATALAALSFACASENVEGCNDRCSAHHVRCQLDPDDCSALCEELTSLELTCLENDGCSAETQAVCIASEGNCTQPASQQVSQPCCPALGIDACGAGLVCAAIEGRTQATCYPERSRADMTECTEDRLCASGSCNTTRGVCRSAIGARCDTTIGCEDDPSGAAVSCEPMQSLGFPVCQRSGLPSGAYCNFNSECASSQCWCERGGRVTCC